MATAIHEPTPLEIARETAAIRTHWNPTTERLRAGLKPRRWSVPTIEILGLVRAAEAARSDEYEQLQHPERFLDLERHRATR